MRKRLTAIIALVVCLAMLLAACGQSGSGDAPANADSGNAASAESKTEDAEAGDQGVDWEDMAEIEFYTFCFVPPADVQHVEDAINAITEEKINTHVHMTVLDVGSYIQQIGIMMAGSERIDVMLTGFATAAFSSMMSQHQLMDITDILEDYGQDILSMNGDMMKGCAQDGRIYAIPSHRNHNSGQYIVMRKDVVEDLGLLEKAENLSSVDEYVEILTAVKNSEKWNYLRPMQVAEAAGFMLTGKSTFGKFSEADVYDLLGDQLGLVHVDDNGHVELAQDTPAYRAAAAKMHEMYEKGLVYRDLSGEVPNMEELIGSDVLFSFTSVTEFGAEETYPTRCGMDVVVVKVCSSKLTSESCTSWCYQVPITAQEPNAAVAFLNLCYTTPELNNLLAWGEEGRDYEVTDGIAHYIEGNENPEYHTFDYSVPNGYVLTPWEGHAADFYIRSEEDMNTVTLSKYLGFVADLDDVSTEMAACSNVTNEYHLQLQGGEASEEVVQEYIDKLYASGAQKIIDAYQEQLDAWLAAQ